MTTFEIGNPALWRCIAVAAALTAGRAAAQATDAHAELPLAPPGTPFAFEVIESHDADYLGDTPAHEGRDGGLTVRPNVALGDAVYRNEKQGPRIVGRITRVAWNRVSGSLDLEFDPVPLQRVAVGDVVWVDLNPAPAKGSEAAAPAAGR